MRCAISAFYSHIAAARIHYDCRRLGFTIRGTIDCLIAQIAIEHDLPLLHNDRDYDAISRVRPLKSVELGGRYRLGALGDRGSAINHLCARWRPAPITSAILTSTMSIDLTRLSEGELLDLHRRITERLQLINAARRLTQLASFSTGMTVEFSADDGRVIRGTIARLNRRTATVVTASGSWRVSPSLLRVVGETAAPAASPRVLSMPAHRHRS